MYALNSKSNFEKELHSLKLKLETKIRILSEKISFREVSPSRLQSSEINKLKLSYYKLEKALKILEELSEENWNRHKGSFHKHFNDAAQLLV